MPVIAMQKVAIFGHAQAKTETLAILQKNEVLEVSPFPQLESRALEEPEWELDLTCVRSTIEYLDKVVGRKKSFIESFAPFKEVVEEETILSTAREFDWKEIVYRVESLETELSNLDGLERKLKEEIALLAPWEKVAVPLEQLSCSKRTCLIAGFCKTPAWPQLNHKMARFSSLLQIEVIDHDKEFTSLLIFHLPEEKHSLHDLLFKSGFEKVNLPSSKNTPAQEIIQAKEILRRTAKDRMAIRDELISLYKYRTQLTYMHDFFLQKSNEKVARQQMAHTRSAFILTGWVMANKLEKIKQGLPALTEIRPIAPEQNEKAPTRLANAALFYPFELITRIFGLPAQNEIDPTGPLSFFYLLFFAMCLSDVGYGALLTILAYYYLRTLTLSEGGKKLLLLLLWGGIATIMAGVLTGSYFGLDLNLLPQPLGEFLKRLQVIDPIKNPLNVLILSLALGVFQNLTGIAVSFYWKIRSREYLSAWLDDALWFLFLSCLVSLVVTIGLGSPLTVTFRNLSIIGAILLTFTQGRSEKGIIKKFLFGLLSLYRTTSYLGDTLSYSRLLALMMTTSIIGMVVNIIAGLTKDSVPVLGYLFMAAILIVGHIFNLVVSTLGAFIHATRLQLVEFFGKFYAGSGREWKPFRRDTKYVIIR